MFALGISRRGLARMTLLGLLLAFSPSRGGVVSMDDWDARIGGFDPTRFTDTGTSNVLRPTVKSW